MKLRIAITMDLERDWHGSCCYRANEYPSGYEARASFKSAGKVMPFFVKTASDYDMEYTVFVTGEFARNRPDILVELDAEIGVHSHPIFHYPNCQDDRLEAYGLEEQKRIVSEDKNLVEDAMGKRIHLFRAGRLAADINTYIALQSLRFRIDSSLRFGVNLNGWTAQEMKSVSIIECPIYGIVSCRTRLNRYIGLIKVLKLLNIEGDFVFYLHPQEYGDIHIDGKRHLERFREFIQSLYAYDAEFIKISDFCQTRRARALDILAFSTCSEPRTMLHALSLIQSTDRIRISSCLQEVISHSSPSLEDITRC